jgi:dolichyl-phosphate-mannose-protein mannosyltransferase
MPAGTKSRIEAAAASLLIVSAVAVIYRGAVVSYFFNDDFNWFDEAQRFAFTNLVHIERYNHFYRPVVEVYFFAGRRLFGCAALPFHLLSVAIHLANTLLVYLFARDLSGRRDFGFFAALFFCTQPGYYEAVAWVAAITDLLPGLWYLLTLWLFLRFLRSRRRPWYGAALIAFTLCLLTHESSATLLPMLIVLDLAEIGGARAFQASGRSESLRTAVLRYAPFAVLLAASLTITYVVNSRSYLVREGHYQFGWHAVPHLAQFILSLYVGPRSMASYLLIAAVTSLLLWRGSARVRFAVVFLFATLAPASFFTWGNVSRYLYVPAAAFALLLAEGAIAIEALLMARLARRTAHAVVMVLAIAVAVRFSVYAEKSAWSFRDLTLPYERFVSAARRANPSGSSGTPLALTPADVENIPVAFYDVAAGAAFCGPPLHVVVP